MSPAARNPEVLLVPEDVVAETWQALRSFGRKRCEGFVAWVGAHRDGTAEVHSAIVPEQESIQSEEGVGYFLSTQALFALNVYLSEQKLSLIAQVHSHPTEAYHSEMDDAYAIVTREGGYSIVVPDFASGPAEPDNCAIYRLRKSCWTRMSKAEVAVVCRWGGT